VGQLLPPERRAPELDISTAAAAAAAAAAAGRDDVVYSASVQVADIATTTTVRRVELTIFHSVESG